VSTARVIIDIDILYTMFVGFWHYIIICMNISLVP